MSIPERTAHNDIHITRERQKIIEDFWQIINGPVPYAAVATQHENKVPPHSRILATFFLRPNVDREEFNVHLRHVPADLIFGNNNVDSFPLEEILITTPQPENKASDDDSVAIDNFGAQATGFRYTGEIITTKVDLHITKKDGIWSVQGSGDNEWDQPEVSLNTVCQIIKNPEAMHWTPLPSAE